MLSRLEAVWVTVPENILFLHHIFRYSPFLIFKFLGRLWSVVNNAYATLALFFLEYGLIVVVIMIIIMNNLSVYLMIIILYNIIILLQNR